MVTASSAPPRPDRRTRAALGAMNVLMAGMSVRTPANALVDGARHRRAYIVASGVFAVFASSLIGVSRIATAVGGAIAQAAGYRIAFLIPGSFALAASGLWLAFGSPPKWVGAVEASLPRGDPAMAIPP